MVSTVAGNHFGHEDGPLNAALFGFPSQICFDYQGNLLICDDDKIRKISNGVVSTVARGLERFNDESGDVLSSPCICVDEDDSIFVAYFGNSRILKIQHGKVSTLFRDLDGDRGGENGEDSHFNSPVGICIDIDGKLVVFGSDNSKIHVIS